MYAFLNHEKMTLKGDRPLMRTIMAWKKKVSIATGVVDVEPTNQDFTAWQESLCPPPRCPR
jgi:hypothetical protein